MNLVAEKYTGIVVSHTHWDREWYLTYLEFRVRLVKLMDKLLRICNDPKFDSFDSFQLDGQTLPLEDYLAVRPENEKLLEKYISAGKIVVGPWYVLADEFLESAEGIIRNLLLGHKISAKFGATMKVGYVPDTFGHVWQLPQILQGFNIPYIYVFRGYPPLFGGFEEYKGKNDDTPLEYFWAAPDGTTVLTLHHIVGYGNAANLCQAGDQANKFPDLKFISGYSKILLSTQRLIPRTRTKYLLFMNGSDHLEPEEDLPEFITAWNENDEIREEEGLNVELKQGKLVDYFKGLEGSGISFPTIAGEMRGSAYTQVTPGCISTRMYLKQQNFQSQRMLERYSEPACALANACVGHPYDHAFLWEAWKYTLQNHPHDSICGCSLDRVHEDMETRFAWSLDISYLLADKALSALTNGLRVPEFGKTPSGSIFAAWNLSSNPNPQLVTSLVPAMGAGPYQIVDAQGKEVPGALVERIEDYRELPRGQYLYKKFLGHFAVCRVSFLETLPSYGCNVYKLIEAQPKQSRILPEGVTPVKRTELVIDNGRIQVTFHENGTFDLKDNETGREFRDCLLFEDMADDGDEYDYSSLPNETPLTTRNLKASIKCLIESPLKVVFRVTSSFEVPKELEGDWTKGKPRSRSAMKNTLHITTFVTVVAGQKYVDIRTSVKNTAQDHRLRVLFPTDLRASYSFADDHFMVERRDISLPPDKGWYQPMQGIYHQDMFVDVSDDQNTYGLAVLNRGLPEYEILPKRNVIALTLFRAVGWLSKQTHLGRPTGLNGPALPTPGAQCLREFDFEYALCPHAGNWTNPEFCNIVQSYLAPPLLHQKDIFVTTPKTFDAGMSLLCVENPLLRISTIKKTESGDAVLIRIYNPSSVKQTGDVQFNFSVTSVSVGDLLEQSTENVKLVKNGFKVTLDPYKIRSFNLTFS